MYDINHHHHRRSIRLRNYNYAQNGMYFVTICIQHHQCMLGEINNHIMINNDAGNMIDKWLQKIPEKFHDIILDEYIVMPNHLHAIMINTGPDGSNGPVGADPCVCPNDEPIDSSQPIDSIKSMDSNKLIDIPPFFGIEGEHMGSPLHRVVQWIKTMSTNEYIRNVKSNGWQPFDRKLWQRNYYEHIIRDNESYQRIKQYIIDNPLKWGNKPGFH